MTDLTWWHWLVLIFLVLIFILLLVLVIMLFYAGFSILDSLSKLVCWIRYIIGRIISDITFVENLVKQTVDDFHRNANHLQSQISQVQEAFHITPQLAVQN